MLAGTLLAKPRSWQWRNNLSFSSVSFVQPPTPREVHMWCLFPNEIHQSSLLCSYESILSDEERTLVSQTKNMKVQKEYILTRMLARTLLARYTGDHVNPMALEFQRSTFGKPQIVWPSYTSSGRLLDPPKISFNISHTKSLIVCVVTGAFQVGIDVEEKYRETHTNIIRFAKRKFSVVEAQRLEQFSNLEACKNHFLQLWTLKESYGKALGKGIIGTTLRDTAFHFCEFSNALDVLEYITGLQAHKQLFQIRPYIQGDSNVWQFVLLQPTEAHYASICVQLNQSLEEDCEMMEPLHVQVMKTIPLVKDEPLLEAVALGLSI